MGDASRLLRPLRQKPPESLESLIQWLQEQKEGKRIGKLLGRSTVEERFPHVHVCLKLENYVINPVSSLQSSSKHRSLCTAIGIS